MNETEQVARSSSSVDRFEEEPVSLNLDELSEMIRSNQRQQTMMKQLARYLAVEEREKAKVNWEMVAEFQGYLGQVWSRTSLRYKLINRVFDENHISSKYGHIGFTLKEMIHGVKYLPGVEDYRFEPVEAMRKIIEQWIADANRDRAATKDGYRIHGTPTGKWLEFRYRISGDEDYDKQKGHLEQRVQWADTARQSRKDEATELQLVKQQPQQPAVTIVSAPSSQENKEGEGAQQ